jgi:hypothetical protein
MHEGYDIDSEDGTRSKFCLDAVTGPDISSNRGLPPMDFANHENSYLHETLSLLKSITTDD